MIKEITMELIRQEMLARVLTIVQGATGCITYEENGFTKIVSFDDYDELIVNTLEENGGKMIDVKDAL